MRLPPHATSTRPTHLAIRLAGHSQRLPTLISRPWAAYSGFLAAARISLHFISSHFTGRYIMDRAKDLIIRGGENISCAEARILP